MVGTTHFVHHLHHCLAAAGDLGLGFAHRPVAQAVHQVAVQLPRVSKQELGTR